LASQSKEDSMYTLDFSNTFGEISPSEFQKKFKRGVRGHADVKRDLKLPSIQLKSNQMDVNTSNLKHSYSTGAINSKAFGDPSTHRRNFPWISKSQSTVQLGGGDDDLGKLIALRNIEKEMKQFINLCRDSLHKRPWSKVNQRFV
jgi:hypothetical protein